jgi:large subunit ribosomal protein L25
MEKFVLAAEPRSQFGSRAAKRLREKGLLPANVYGHKQENLLVSLNAKEFSRFLEAGHRILTVRVGGKDESAVVREVQYDAYGSSLVHVDFTRVSMDERIQMAVAVAPIGVAKGVASGGVLEFPLKEVLVSGLPGEIPEALEVNIEKLELGSAIRIKDLAAPAGCQFVQDPELVVIHVTVPRTEAPPPVVEAEPTQPELIAKRKEEEPEVPAVEEKKGAEKKKEKEKEK